MTTTRRDDNDTEFGNWLRVNPILHSRKYGFAAHNIDYAWYAFKQDWIILIEEKRMGVNQKFSQTETHNIIHQIMENGCKFPIQTSYGEKTIEYRGYYLIQFEKTNPDDSEWIKINGIEYSKGDLLHLLKYGKLLHTDWNLPVPLLKKELPELSLGQISEIKNHLKTTPAKTSSAHTQRVNQ